MKRITSVPCKVTFVVQSLSLYCLFAFLLSACAPQDNRSLIIGEWVSGDMGPTLFSRSRVSHFIFKENKTIEIRNVFHDQSYLSEVGTYRFIDDAHIEAHFEETNRKYSYTFEIVTITRGTLIIKRKRGLVLEGQEPFESMKLTKLK